MNNIIETLKKYWWVLAIIVVLVLIISRIGGKKPDAKFDIDAIQTQIENEPKLKENINSPRNNFKGGSYNLDESVSTISLEFDKKTVTVPVKSGSMTVLDKGRIKNFSIEADLSAMTGADAATVKKALGINGASPLSLQGLTVLPNTTDDAFTVAFALTALGKDASFATGLTVTKDGSGIKVMGPINLDKSLLGLPGTLTLTPNFIFN